MTDQLNGTAPPDPLQSAKLRFAKAYTLAIAPGGQLQFNPLQILVELELLKIHLGVLINMACANGMDATEFNLVSVAQLNAQAQALEGPQIAVAPANALGRKR